MIRSFALGAALCLSTLALPATADFRTNVSQGWADFFYAAPLGSARCEAIADIEPAIAARRALVSNPLNASLLTSARTSYRETATLCEWAVRFDIADAQALVDRMAPECGWTAESPHPKAAHVSRCLAAALRDLVRGYRQAEQAPPPEPEPVEDLLP